MSAQTPANIGAATERPGLLTAALAYAGRGWRVFPCEPEAKQPITKRGHRDATVDANQIRAWWTKTPNANIGLSLEASGLVVVDADIQT